MAISRGSMALISTGSEMKTELSTKVDLPCNQKALGWRPLVELREGVSLNYQDFINFEQAARR
jgi:hypothetical protein